MLYKTDRSAKNIALEQGLLRLDRADGLLIRVIFDSPTRRARSPPFSSAGPVARWYGRFLIRAIGSVQSAGMSCLRVRQKA